MSNVVKMSIPYSNPLFDWVLTQRLISPQYGRVKLFDFSPRAG